MKGLRSALVGAGLLVVLAAGCAQSNPKYRVDKPSFHSAGPAAQEEIQSVLKAQADSIEAGDWGGLFAMYVPSQRSRCTLGQFAQAASTQFGSLRTQTQGAGLTAVVSGLQVNGFRASVDYRFELQALSLTSPSQTAHYLKLGDRWFIDEKAC